MSNKKVAYLRIPRPEGYSDKANDVRHEERVIFVRVDPRQILKGTFLEFFEYNHENAGPARMVPMYGAIEALPEGFPMLSSLAACESFLEEMHKDNLEASFGKVGKIIGEQIFLPLRKLEGLIKALQSGETAVADELIAKFIKQAFNTCYDLANHLGDIEALNAALEEKADLAVSTASQAIHRAKVAEKDAERAKKAAQADREEWWMDWIDAALAVCREGDSLTEMGIEKERQTETVRTKIINWQKQLDDEDLINDYIRDLEATRAQIEAELEQRPLNKDRLKELHNECVSLLEDLEKHELSVNGEFDKTFESVETLHESDREEMKALGKRLLKALRVFSRNHEEYKDKKKRWDGTGVEPILPYEPACAYRECITQKQYEQAVSIAEDDDKDTFALQERINEALLRLRRLKEQRPCYSETTQELLRNARIATRDVAAVIGIKPEPAKPVEATPEPSAPAQPKPTVEIPAPTELSVKLQLVYDYMLIVGYGITGRSNNTWSNLTFPSLLDKSLTLLEQKFERPELSDEDEGALKTYLYSSSQSCRIQGEKHHPQVRKVYRDDKASCIWIVYDPSRNRKRVVKFHGSQDAYARAAAERRQFDLDAYTVQIDKEREDAKQKRKEEKEAKQSASSPEEASDPQGSATADPEPPPDPTAAPEENPPLTDTPEEETMDTQADPSTSDEPPASTPEEPEPVESNGTTKPQAGEEPPKAKPSSGLQKLDTSPHIIKLYELCLATAYAGREQEVEQITLEQMMGALVMMRKCSNEDAKSSKGSVFQHILRNGENLDDHTSKDGAIESSNKSWVIHLNGSDNPELWLTDTGADEAYDCLILHDINPSRAEIALERAAVKKD